MTSTSDKPSPSPSSAVKPTWADDLRATARKQTLTIILDGIQNAAMTGKSYVTFDKFHFMDADMIHALRKKGLDVSLKHYRGLCISWE